MADFLSSDEERLKKRSKKKLAIYKEVMREFIRLGTKTMMRIQDEYPEIFRKASRLVTNLQNYK